MIVRKEKFFLAIAVIVVMVVFKIGTTSSYDKEPQQVDHTAFVLDTAVDFSVWTNDQVDEEQAKIILTQAENLCRHYEQMMSKSIETSDVYRLNHANGEEVLIDVETARLIEKAIKYSELSDGYFDITILPVKELWDFKAQNPQVSTQEQIPLVRNT